MADRDFAAWSWGEQHRALYDEARRARESEAALLEALKALLARHNEDCPCAGCDDARAAIAKAEGPK